MMKILASDFDGTIRYPADVAAITRFRAAGHLFGIVTGREYPSIYPKLKSIQLPFDFVLPQSGAQGFDEDGRLLFEVPIRGRVARQVVEICGKYTDHPIHCQRGRDECFSFSTHTPDGDASLLPLNKADELTDMIQFHTKFATIEQSDACVAELRRELGDRLNPLQNHVCLDIPAAGMDKGAGVARYAALMGVDCDRVFCVGDHLNDSAMITRFHGNAVANATPLLKEQAELHFDTVTDLIDHLLTQE